MRRNEHIHCADGEAFPLQSGPDPTIGFGRISVKRGEIEGETNSSRASRFLLGRALLAAPYSNQPE